VKVTIDICQAAKPRSDLWFEDILAGRSDRIDRTFAKAGAPAPTTLWTPRADEAQTAPIRHLIHYFDRKFAASERAEGATLDPAEFRPALGYVNVVEPVDGGRDFRFRIFGTFVAAVTGCDLTGQLLSQMPASDYVVDHALACYRAAHARRLPLLSLRIPLGAASTRRWERLLLPFVDASGTVSRLLVGVVPIGLAGMPMRPQLLSGA
jgi:hypothetical protein